jgi:hypothetical protein
MALLQVDLRLRRAIGWWTVVTWAIYLITFPPTLMFEVTKLKVILLAVGIAGFVGGILALREIGIWRLIVPVAYGLLIGLMVVYWIFLVGRIAEGESDKSAAVLLDRVWTLHSIPFVQSFSHGYVGGMLATLYRETIMPLLQSGAVLVFAFRSIRAAPNNGMHQTRAEAARDGDTER